MVNEIIAQLIALQEQPEPFKTGEPLFWDDPLISSQMLKFHFDLQINAANLKPETIDHSVDWIIRTLRLTPGASLLDLGCGPGLYASHFAGVGFRVTGWTIPAVPSPTSQITPKRINSTSSIAVRTSSTWTMNPSTMPPSSSMATSAHFAPNGA